MIIFFREINLTMIISFFREINFTIIFFFSREIRYLIGWPRKLKRLQVDPGQPRASVDHLAILEDLTLGKMK